MKLKAILLTWVYMFAAVCLLNYAVGYFKPDAALINYWVILVGTLVFAVAVSFRKSISKKQ